MKVTLPCIFFTTLFLIGLTATAQRKFSYDRLFYKIDSLALEHKAKEALILINQVNEQARKEGRTTMLLKSVMYRMLFQNYIDPTAQAKLIKILRNDIAAAKQPEKSILQSLLAESYWHYYQHNRYKISQRTFVSSDIGDNIETWSIRKVTNELVQNYLSSLSEKKTLQSTRIDLIKEVLVGDSATRYLRPTLYDLLAHRAIDVFMNSQSTVANAGVDDISFDKRLWMDSRSFMETSFSDSDSISFGASTFLNILKELLTFHNHSGNHAAFADADLKRLKFSYQLSRQDDKNQQYLGALEQLLPTATGTDIYTDILYEQAKSYVNNPSNGDKTNLTKAIALIDEAVKSRPGSPGARNADQLGKQVKTMELALNMKDQIIPNQPMEIFISYKNIQSAYFWLYKVPSDDPGLRSPSDNKTHYYNLVKDIKPIRKFKTELLVYSDYYKHTFADYLEGLPLGTYILLAQSKEILDTIGEGTVNNINTFTVSDLGVNYRTIESNLHQYVVRSSTTGKPLKQVKIEEMIYRGYNTDFVPGPIMLTNEEGSADSDPVQNVSRALLTLDNDTVSVDISSGRRRYVTEKNVVFFTDRPIYRPGQTVFYKGLYMESLDGKNDILPNKELVVLFRDVNNEVLNRVTVNTNEFGTFHGSFQIPMGKLNGNFRISTTYGDMNVQVEEYKRPTFELLFDDPKEKYKLGDSILVKGSAIAFSGYQIGSAVVKYTVHRAQNPDYRNYSDQEIKLVASGTSGTLENGTFSVKFFPMENVNNKKHFYNYIVKAEITSQGGETRVAEKIIAVGEKDIRLITHAPEFLHLDNKVDTIHAVVQNLNGQSIKGNLKIDWYALQAPGRLANKRMFYQLPDNYRLSRDEFIQAFPYDEYGNENQPAKWPAAPTATFSQDINVENGEAPILLSSNDLKPGYYKLVFSAKNLDNDTVKKESIMRIYWPRPEKILSMNEWLIGEKLNITPKEQAVFRIAGITADALAYYEVYYKNEIAEKVWINLSPEQRIIKISPKAHYEKAFAVQFSMIQNGVAYNMLQTIIIEDNTKEMDIRFLSFRDKLQPGEKETWKIKISNKAGEKQMAEMVATLYDASLDALKKMEWHEIHAGFYYGGYTWTNHMASISQGSSLRFSGYRYEYINNIVRQYERLNSFSLPYAGNGSNAYNVYLNAADKQFLLRDSVEMVEKLAVLKNGRNVYGIVRDQYGFVIPDAVILVNKKEQGKSDRLGIYEITASAGAVISIVVARHLPYSVKLKPGERRKDLTLTSVDNNLKEVVIRGYQKRTREATTGSSFIVGGNEANSGAPGMKGSVNIRGVSSVSDQTVLLQGKVAGKEVVEDTKVYDFVSLNSYDPKTGTYIINGKRVRHLGKVATRTNFNETAFFFPQLRTNSSGEILIEFIIPQSLTRFKMMGFAHTKDMMNTIVGRTLITQKQFAITAQAPRFFRERDTIWINATLNNLSGKKLKGNAALELSDALTGKPVQLMMQGAGVAQGQRFEVSDKGNQTLKWPLIIPSGISAINYKVIAESGKYSDGEEMTVPVLPNSMLVTETMPLNVRGNSSKTFTMDKLLQSGSSPTLRHQSYTLEFTSNPAWYAIQSLPYLMEYPFECAEQTFSRFYANSFASTIVNSSPKIAEVFKQWQEMDNGQALLSNLEKNQQLKSILLEETPWVRNSASESERKKRLGVLFDLQRMSNELKRNFEKLEQMQYANGSFPWFSGMPENRYITQHIVLGMAQMKHLKVVDLEAYPNFNIMLNKAIIYLDAQLSSDYIIAQKELRADYLPLHYLYARSYSKQINTGETFNKALTYYLSKIATQWGTMSLYQQGLAALVLHRSGNHQEAMKIVNALKERSQISEEMGMFWPGNTNGWWWHQSSVETQALMVEVFDEVASDTKSVEELKIWLLKNKQTTDWKTTKATTAACYALLMRGHNLLEESAEPEILIADKTYAQLGIAEPTKEAGTGYRKVSLQGAQITPELGKITVKNNNKGIAWGGVYWQYFEQLDKITQAATGIRIKKQLFIQELTTSGKILHPLSAARVLKPGDLLKVRIEIYADRDMEYLHLKDMRSAGFEPVNVISSYKYQDGLGYYESTKDASTNFFIDFMRKGTYVFEYPLRVSHAGNFSNGITTLQSMYAPEFSTHSEDIRVTVKP